MKRLISLLIVFLIACISYSQPDSLKIKSTVYGVGSGGLITANSYTINYYVHFSIEKGKNKFAVGPIFGPKVILTPYSPPSSYENEYSLKGIDLVYQRYLGKKGKIIDFFFQYHMIGFYYLSNGVGSFGSSFQSKVMRLDNYLNIGFNAKILKNLYLTQTLGAGIYFEDFDYKPTHPEEWNYKEQYWRPSLIISTGITYNFN